MTCRVQRLPGGSTAIVCGPRHPPPRRCGWCSRPGRFLCDAPRAKPEFGKPAPPTCDAAICVAHKTSVGVNRDLCPDHAGLRDPVSGRLRAAAGEGGTPIPTQEQEDPKR